MKSLNINESLSTVSGWHLHFPHCWLLQCHHQSHVHRLLWNCCYCLVKLFFMIFFFYKYFNISGVTEHLGLLGMLLIWLVVNPPHSLFSPGSTQLRDWSWSSGCSPWWTTRLPPTTMVSITTQTGVMSSAGSSHSSPSQRCPSSPSSRSSRPSQEPTSGRSSATPGDPRLITVPAAEPSWMNPRELTLTDLSRVSWTLTRRTICSIIITQVMTNLRKFSKIL